MKSVKGYLFILLGISLFVSGCTTVAQSKTQDKVEIILKEYSIGSGQIRLTESEQPVNVTIKNKGMNAHNFVIEELGLDTGLINPGDSVTMEVNVKDVSLLHAKCTLPGHTEAGMVAEVIVSHK
jgi:uncharacterized cupredoxin-like copper-binding protein